MALEHALSDPLANGRVTLENGRIGISGNVLFAINSAELQPEGRELLASLVAPLKVYLSDREQILMVSGFTDDLAIQDNNLHYKDNWDLSAARALTVTRAMIDAGIPSSMVFAAAFGSEQPVVANVDKQSRAKNRRVELAPVPKMKTVEQP
jgi:flagellar motor protein MotB